MVIKVSKTNGVHGEVNISGSKNSALPCLCASILTKEWMTFKNVPKIEDVSHMIKVLKSIGCEVVYLEYNLKIRAKKVKSNIKTDEVSKIRASYYIMGVMLSRLGKVKIKMPGGCDLGKRPIDFHLDVFQNLGCKIKTAKDYLIINGELMHPTIFIFARESVGATINAIFASVLIKGTTILKNASIEPEVRDVINLLIKMGAKIIVKESRDIIITGVKKLSKAEHYIMFDRMEAGSYLFLAGALPNSNLKISRINPIDLKTVISVARASKIKVEVNRDAIIVKSSNVVAPIDLMIGPFPFFPTDLQQIITSFLLRAKDISNIEDTIFPGRISHIKELNKLNAQVLINNEKKIRIYPSKLKGATVEAHDLRCAMSLVIAGAMAEGDTYIHQAEHILRGYENPIGKMKAIGLLIDEISE